MNVKTWAGAAAASHTIHCFIHGLSQVELDRLFCPTSPNPSFKTVWQKEAGHSDIYEAATSKSIRISY